MIWKTILVTFLAVGVLAEYEITDSRREQLKSLLTELCKRNGAEDKVESVEKAGHNFIECMKGLLDIEQIKKEIEEAKPNGALDEVFKKYCAKTPELKSCIHTLIDGIVPCADATVREHVSTFYNGTDQLIDFVCYKDGDRIALFIAEAGPQCFQAKVNDIRECALKIKEIGSIEEAKTMTLDQRCGKFDELSTCIVQALEKCETPTPANMAESLFRFIRKSSPCKK